MARKGYKAYRSLPLGKWSEADQLACKAALPNDPAEAASIGPLPGAQRKALISVDHARNVRLCAERFMASVKVKFPELMAQPIAERITPDTVANFCIDLKKKVKDETIADYLVRLETFAARLEPETNWFWILEASYAIRPELKPKSGSPVSKDDLVAAGERLMNSARQKLAEAEPSNKRLAKKHKRAIGKLFRDGLMLAFLAQHPYRISNFASLEIDASLRRLPNCYKIYLPAETTKTGKAIASRTRKILTNAIEEYITSYRPLLSNADRSQMLLLPSKGSCFGEQSVRDAINLRTEQMFKVRITPHKFRHANADDEIDNENREPEDVSRELGHAHRDMTRRRYRRSAGSKQAKQRGTDRISKILRRRRK